MLIILHEAMVCLSQQPWGICWITWSSCCVVHTVHLFIKLCSCILSAYLSNNSYIITERIHNWNLVYERSAELSDETMTCNCWEQIVAHLQWKAAETVPVNFITFICLHIRNWGMLHRFAWNLVLWGVTKFVTTFKGWLNSSSNRHYVMTYICFCVYLWGNLQNLSAEEEKIWTKV